MSTRPVGTITDVPGQMSFDEVLGVGSRSEPDLELELELEDQGAPAPLDVAVIRSPRRRKTAQARLVGSTVEVRIPARCSPAQEAELVDHFRAKFERARSAERIDLEARARTLAAAHGLPEPSSIRWVSNQRHRWGSCTPADGSVRLSDRMTSFPRWVVDYVIVHELAHLVEDNHSDAFWRLVEAYPLTERARGYLLAMATQDHPNHL